MNKSEVQVIGLIIDYLKKSSAGARQVVENEEYYKPDNLVDFGIDYAAPLREPLRDLVEKVDRTIEVLGTLIK